MGGSRSGRRRRLPRLEWKVRRGPHQNGGFEGAPSGEHGDRPRDGTVRLRHFRRRTIRGTLLFSRAHARIIDIDELGRFIRNLASCVDAYAVQRAAAAASASDAIQDPAVTKTAALRKVHGRGGESMELEPAQRRREAPIPVSFDGCEGNASGARTREIDDIEEGFNQL
jgi:hypothetical protein